MTLSCECERVKNSLAVITIWNFSSVGVRISNGICLVIVQMKYLGSSLF